MQVRFPKEFAQWQNFVERMLLQEDVDIKRAWKTIPQIPDPECGFPLSAGLNPAIWCWPGRPECINTGGTLPSMGTRSFPSGSPPVPQTAGGCPGGPCSLCCSSPMTWLLDISRLIPSGVGYNCTDFEGSVIGPWSLNWVEEQTYYNPEAPTSKIAVICIYRSDVFAACGNSYYWEAGNIWSAYSDNGLHHYIYLFNESTSGSPGIAPPFPLIVGRSTLSINNPGCLAAGEYLFSNQSPFGASPPFAQAYGSIVEGP